MPRIFRVAEATASVADDLGAGVMQIVGIGVVACALAVIVIVTLVYYVVRRRRRQLAIEDRFEARLWAIKTHTAMASLINTWHEKADYLPIEFDNDLARLPAGLRREYEDRRSGIIALVDDAARMHASIVQEGLDPKATDSYLTTSAYLAMVNRFTEVIEAFEIAADLLVTLKQDIEEDVDRYSFEDQQDRLNDLKRRLSTVRHAFSDFDTVFEVSQQKSLIDFLAHRLDQAEGSLSLRQEQERTFKILEDAEMDLVGLEAEAESHADVAQILRDPRQQMLEAVAKARAQLKKFKRIDTGAAESELDSLEAYANSSISQFRPRRKPGEQVNFINEFNQRVARIVHDVEEADKKRKEDEHCSFYTGAGRRYLDGTTNNDMLAIGVVTSLLGSPNSNR